MKGSSKELAALTLVWSGAYFHCPNSPEIQFTLDRVALLL